jgi:hypothetical protein
MGQPGIPGRHELNNEKGSRRNRVGGLFFPLLPLHHTMKRSTNPASTIANCILLPAVVAYIGLHLWSLSWFPFVHSDEAWLASLSRTMWSGGPAATEEFFRLTQRNPHALKTVYHYLQGPLVSRWWTVEAARIPSLLAGLASLAFLGDILRRLTGLILPSLILAAAFALDPQVFYISHLARQEALLTAFMLAAVWVLVRGRSRAGSPIVPVAVAALLLGISIFAHPNAFIAAAATLPWVFYSTPAGSRIRSVLVYTAVLGVAAALAVGASTLMDPDFVSNYRALGESLGVTATPVQRWARLREFFLKMGQRHAGTYYLPPVALQLSVLAFLTGIALVRPWLRGLRTERSASTAAAVSALATATAIFIIGKYSPPGTIFLHPWVYILTGTLTGEFLRGHSAATGHERVPPVVAGLVIVPLAMMVLLATELAHWHPGGVEGNRYDQYISRIRESVPPGEVALANLNSAFAFEPGELRVWRDLGALARRDDLLESSREVSLLNRPFGRFLLEENVRWVVLPVEELAMIYGERPVWNEVYGNPHRFYPDLMEILRTWGTEVDRFESSWYGMRIVPFMKRGSHHVEIYRLDLPVPREAAP